MRNQGSERLSELSNATQPGRRETCLLLLCSDWGPLPGGGVPWDPFPRPYLLTRCLAALGRVCWSEEALGCFLTGSPKCLAKASLRGEGSIGESAGGVMEL